MVQRALVCRAIAEEVIVRSTTVEHVARLREVHVGRSRSRLLGGELFRHADLHDVVVSGAHRVHPVGADDGHDDQPDRQ